jgi:protein-S-isoprenylcysteine O-methyltransferase Ste14
MKSPLALRPFYKRRSWLLVPPLVFLVLCTWAEVENEWLVFGLGGAALCAGVALRIWAQTHLHNRLSPKTLTTAGPYAYVRNPLYIGNILIMTAACFLSELLWFAPIMLAYCATMYTLIVRYEEYRLLMKYQQHYEEYVRRVPRWLPRRRSVRSSCGTNALAFLYRSILVESGSLLLIIPFILKELACQG